MSGPSWFTSWVTYQHAAALSCATEWCRKSRRCIRFAVNLQQAKNGLAVPDQVLLDVGAGAGYFSLAAAARGHRAIAVELSNFSLASLKASVAYNGFGKLIIVHKARAQPWACALCIMSMLWLAWSGCIPQAGLQGVLEFATHPLDREQLI